MQEPRGDDGEPEWNRPPRSGANSITREQRCATTPKVENTAAVPLAVSTDVPKRVVETMWKYTGSKGAHDPPLEK